MQMNQIRHRVGVAGVLLPFILNSIGTAAAATHTWTGGGPSQNWSSVANWSGGIPTANEAPPVVLIFPANFSGPFTNNIANLKVDEIRLLGSGQTLRGANGVSLTLRSGNTNTNVYSAGINSFDSTLSLVLEGTNGIVSPVLFTFFSQISGSGGLEINGTVMLDGDAANTFTGATILKSGTLTLNKEVVPVSEPLGLVSVFGPLIIEGGRVAHSSDHGIGNTSTVTIHPSATLDLNDYDDTIGALNFLGGTAETDAGTLTLGGNVTATGNASISGKLSLGGTTRTFDVALSRTLTVSASITSGPGFNNAGLWKTGAGKLILSGANGFSGNASVSAGELEVQHNSALGLDLLGTTVASGATLALGDGVIITTEALGLAGTLKTTGTATWAGLINLTGNTEFAAVNPGNQLSLLGAIAGTGDVLFNGQGWTILDGNADNTYAGSTHTSATQLHLNKPNGAIAIPGDLTIGGWIGANNSRLVYAVEPGQIASNATITINPTGKLLLTSGNQTVAGLVLQGGELDSGNATVLLDGDVTALASDQVARISGKLSLNGGPREFLIEPSAAAPPLEVSAVISGLGSSGLTKSGLGELRLSGANNYSGPTVVAAGTLGVFHSTALGSVGAGSPLHGTTVAVGASLLLNSVSVGTEYLYLRSNGYLGAGVLFNQQGDNSWAGIIELTESTFINVMPGSSLNLAGKITGTGDLTKWGSGTLKLSGETSNDFEGQTRIEGGTLQLAKKHSYRAVPRWLRIGALEGPPVTVTALSNNQFGASQTGITIQPGCTFNLNQSTQHISNLNGSGEVQIPGTLQLAYGSYGGVISGNGTLLVANAWTGGLRITGTNNTFTGQTYVDFAHFFVDGIWPGVVHAFSSGGVGGSGVVGNVDISVGRLTPGVGHYGTAHLRTGHLALTNNSTFRFETRDVPNGIEYDRVEVSGTVKLDDANFQPILGSAGRSNIAYILILNDGNDPVQGTFNGLPEGATLTLDGGQFDITYQGGTGNDVVLRQQTPTTNSFPVSLTIVPKNANWVTLRWPAYASGYKLEYCTNLATGLWWPSGPLLGENDGTNVVVSEMMINRPISFFRLVHP
jgi:fibronectin-binding autotransporter adhesin